MTTCIYYSAMNSPAIATRQETAARARYRDNFPRHLLGVARHLQTQAMQTLTRQYAHTSLRLNFEPYITLIAGPGARLGDIAAALGISKQAANQTAGRIEAAGYIQRMADPLDRRARRIVLTARGRKLRADGTVVVNGIQREFEALVGRQKLVRMVRLLSGLSLKLELSLSLSKNSHGRQTQTLLAGLLPRLADYTTQRLMALTRSRGHPDLKLSFGQVLSLIGPAGGRIEQIARVHDVSKQAIGAIAGELQALGYIRRDADPADARQVVLQFTPQGLGLIDDSMASVELLEEEFTRLLGARNLASVKQTMAALYTALNPEQDIFAGSVDLRLLARQLQRQLGQANAGVLAGLLNNEQPNLVIKRTRNKENP